MQSSSKAQGTSAPMPVQTEHFGGHHCIQLWWRQHSSTSATITAETERLLPAYLSLALAEVSHSSQTPGWAGNASDTSSNCCFCCRPTSEEAALSLETHHPKSASFQSPHLSIPPVRVTTCPFFLFSSPTSSGGN